MNNRIVITVEVDERIGQESAKDLAAIQKELERVADAITYSSDIGFISKDYGNSGRTTILSEVIIEYDVLESIHENEVESVLTLILERGLKEKFHQVIMGETVTSY